MDYLKSFDGLSIAYGVVGEEKGESAVVLHHGFASTAEINWIRPGVVEALVAAGRRVVYFDARGHGHSDHPHEVERYADSAMARDVSALVEHLGLESFDMAGYSMGSFVTMSVAVSEARLKSCFLGGAGTGQMRVRQPEIARLIAEALEADDPRQVAEPSAKAFRNFADATKQDRLALAAIQRADRASEGEEAGRIAVPVLVVNGERDTMVGEPDSLARLIPGARSLVVPGDHLSAVTRPEFRQALVDWLKR
jgi:pimeloyl-ACP methyl ester carboxylesterase